MKATDDLRDLGEDRVSVPTGFQIRDHVRQAARGIELIHATWLCCPLCHRGIVQVSYGNQIYRYADDERDALALAHLMQGHGWTRETVGEGV